MQTKTIQQIVTFNHVQLHSATYPRIDISVFPLLIKSSESKVLLRCMQVVSLFTHRVTDWEMWENVRLRASKLSRLRFH